VAKNNPNMIAKANGSHNKPPLISKGIIPNEVVKVVKITGLNL
jgi:hypothetical protein